MKYIKSSFISVAVSLNVIRTHAPPKVSNVTAKNAKVLLVDITYDLALT